MFATWLYFCAPTWEFDNVDVLLFESYRSLGSEIWLLIDLGFFFFFLQIEFTCISPAGFPIQKEVLLFLEIQTSAKVLKQLDCAVEGVILLS